MNRDCILEEEENKSNVASVYDINKPEEEKHELDDDYYEEDFEDVPHPSNISIDAENELTQNKTFSNFQINEIEHTNAILMKKVLAHSTRPRQFVEISPTKLRTSAEINRRKQQRKIDHDNLILLKKIQTIKPFGLSKINLTHK